MGVFSKAASLLHKPGEKVGDDRKAGSDAASQNERIDNRLRRRQENKIAELLMPVTAKYGLIGYPLTHSFSPAYFSEKFRTEGIDASYELFPIADINDFLSILEANTGLKGLNVTIPYKECIMPLLDEIDDAAIKVGAVNCICIKENRTKGYNTDIIGFEMSLHNLLNNRRLPAHALVLGTGGASKAVCFVLDKMGITYTKVSRRRSADTIGYQDVNAEILRSATLIINTTPLGMFPDTESWPNLHYDALNSAHMLYDLVYNPQETKFLSLGRARGASIKNGLEMLHGQADAAWELWNR